MKISLNWLKKYVDTSAVSDERLVRLIGARLVEVEGVIDETRKYDNIYIVRVESCEHIPETHLSLCMIDAGREELVQVVCGAPNVRAGMLTAWIAPGAVVPASVHEDAPFVIGKRKMRGYESCGMLAGADELDFGDDHSGIVEIDPGAGFKPGDSLADAFELNDKILEIENKSLTHRPDCFGIIGFAREVAGILGAKFEAEGLSGMPFSGRTFSPSASYAGAPGKTALGAAFSGPSGIYASGLENLKLSSKKALPATPAIKIDSSVCARYTAIVMKKHGELNNKYLTWQDTVLCKSGMRPVSPIVDVTNYLMLLTGQPLHAFDYDKFVEVGGGGKPEIRVRLARAGEKLALLDGKEVELSESDIVICSGEVPVALAGAMGGESTEIDAGTRNIIIESATFSLYNLRKTQMAHGIFSEAITRFTKGQPVHQTLAVAGMCAEMLSSGSKVAGVADEYPKSEKQIVVKITTDEINGLLGTNYDRELVKQTLVNVGFRVTSAEGAAGPVEGLTVESPEWRTDIHIKEDIIEEVGRLLGYDNIEPRAPLHATAERNKMLELKRTVREALARLGANEVLTYSFVSGRLLEKAGLDSAASYKIVNSISPELQYVRQSIVPSLLDKAYLNQKLPVDKFAIFEMNQVYSKAWGETDEKVPQGKMSLGLVVAERKGEGAAFYKAKMYAARLLEELNISAEFLPIRGESEWSKPFEPKRSAEILMNGELVGVVGEFKNSVRHSFKLAPYLAGFEIDLEVVAKNASELKKVELGEKKREDLTVTTDKTYAEALAEVMKEHPDAVITPGVIYQAEGQTTRNITFHIEKRL